MVPFSFNATQLNGWPEYFEKAVKMEVSVVIRLRSMVDTKSKFNFFRTWSCCISN